jgi:bacterioferritin-associated ferredoxin
MEQPRVIDHCECCGLSFADIVDQARQRGTTSVRRLKRELGMGTYCSACRPYLETALETGQTVFEEPTDEK